MIFCLSVSGIWAVSISIDGGNTQTLISKSNLIELFALTGSGDTKIS